MAALHQTTGTTEISASDKLDKYKTCVRSQINQTTSHTERYNYNVSSLSSVSYVKL